MSRGNLHLAKVLIDRGAGVTDFELNAAVWEASETSDTEMVRRFLSMFPCIGHAAPTAFGIAVEKNNRFLVHSLLQCGIDPRGWAQDPVSNYRYRSNHRDVAGWWHSRPYSRTSVLEIIARTGDLAMLQTLLQCTTWTRQEVGCALTVSLGYEKYHIVQCLLEHGADVNQEVGSSPLNIALKHQNVPLTQALITAGSNLNHVPYGGFQHTALQCAVNKDNMELVRVLLKGGADANIPAARGLGAMMLQLAVKNGNIELISMLLKAGADVNNPPALAHGATALQLAVRNGNMGLINMLLEAGADVNQAAGIGYGATALQFAAISRLYRDRSHPA